jgi:hypothetical protein
MSVARLRHRASLFEESALDARGGWRVTCWLESRMETVPHDVLIRIQTEYVEMPQLKLTARQAQRLWSLPTDVWHAAADDLVRRRFLVQTPDGVYMRG